MITFLYPPTLYSDRSTPTYYAYKPHIFYINPYNVESSHPIWAYLLQDPTRYHISVWNKYIYLVLNWKGRCNDLQKSHEK